MGKQRNKSEQELAAEKEADVCSLFKRVFAGPDGERVLAILSKDCHLLDTSFRENPNAMYFVEGERNVIRNILKRLEIDEQLSLKRLRKYYDENLNEGNFGP